MSYDSPLKGVNLSFFSQKPRKEKTERRSKTVIHTSNHIFGTLISVSKLFCEKLFTYWQWTTFKGGRGGRAGRVRELRQWCSKRVVTASMCDNDMTT